MLAVAYGGCAVQLLFCCVGQCWWGSNIDGEGMAPCADAHGDVSASMRRILLRHFVTACVRARCRVFVLEGSVISSSLLCRYYTMSGNAAIAASECLIAVGFVTVTPRVCLHATIKSMCLSGGG